MMRLPSRSPPLTHALVLLKAFSILGANFLRSTHKVFIRENLAHFLTGLGTLLPRMVPAISAFFTNRITVLNTTARSDVLFGAMDQRYIAPYHEMEYAVALGDARPALAETQRYIAVSYTHLTLPTIYSV